MAIYSGLRMEPGMGVELVDTKETGLVVDLEIRSVPLMETGWEKYSVDLMETGSEKSEGVVVHWVILK